LNNLSIKILVSILVLAVIATFVAIPAYFILKQRAEDSRDYRLVLVDPQCLLPTRTVRSLDFVTRSRRIVVICVPRLEASPHLPEDTNRLVQNLAEAAPRDRSIQRAIFVIASRQPALVQYRGTDANQPELAFSGVGSGPRYLEIQRMAAGLPFPLAVEESVRRLAVLLPELNHLKWHKRIALSVLPTFGKSVIDDIGIPSGTLYSELLLRPLISLRLVRIQGVSLYWLGLVLIGFVFGLVRDRLQESLERIVARILPSIAGLCRLIFGLAVEWTVAAPCAGSAILLMGGRAEDRIALSAWNLPGFSEGLLRIGGMGAPTDLALAALFGLMATSVSFAGMAAFIEMAWLPPTAQAEAFEAMKKVPDKSASWLLRLIGDDGLVPHAPITSSLLRMVPHFLRDGFFVTFVAWGLLPRQATLALICFKLPDAVPSIWKVSRSVVRGRAMRQAISERERLDKFPDELLSDPAILRAIDGLSPDEARQRMSQLTSRGLARLDDATLRRRAVVMSSVIAKLPAATWDSIAKGRGTARDVKRVVHAVSLLEPYDRLFWMQMSSRSALAEIEEKPVTRVDQSELDETLGAAATHLNPSIRSSLERVCHGRPRRGDAGVAAKSLYALAPGLPEPHAARLCRVLATSQWLEASLDAPQKHLSAKTSAPPANVVVSRSVTTLAQALGGDFPEGYFVVLRGSDEGPHSMSVDVTSNDSTESPVAVTAVERAMTAAIVQELSHAGPTLEISPDSVIRSGLDWRNTSQRLLHGARRIICIPSCDAEFLWAVKLLRTHSLFTKTVFVMPPSRGQRAHDWDHARIVLEPNGIYLPMYQSEGLVFKLGTGGDVNAEVAIEDGSPLRLVEAIRKMAISPQEAF
jgi:hypothetical protein